MSDPSSNIAMRDLLASAEAGFQSLSTEIAKAFPLASDPPPPPPIVTDIVLRLKVGDDVQKALLSLLPTGGTIALAPGTHVADLVVPERHLTDKLITFTSDTAGLAAAGAMITPDFKPGMAVLKAASGGTIFKGQNKSCNIALVNIAIGPTAVGQTQFAIGGDQTETPTPDVLPSAFLFDRVLVFGDPLTGAHRGIQMHGDGIKVTGSYFKDIFEVGRDSQAVSSWNGGRNIVLENSFFEASGENIMFGGSDSASPLMTTMDVIIRNCHLSKNFSWMSLAALPSIKSILEVKNVKRLLVDGCLLENNWARDWPTGVGVMLKACNGAKNEIWATAEDVTIQDCIIRNVGSPFGIVGYGDGGRVSDRARRLVLRNILIYGINQGSFKGTGHGCPIANPPDGLTIDHVTMFKNSHSWINTWFDHGQPPGSSLTFTNNVVCNDAYGYIGDNGTGMTGIAKDWQASTVSNNAFQTGTRSLGTMPPSNVLVASIAASLDEKLRVKPGSEIATKVQTSDGSPTVGADVDAIIAKVGDVFAVA